MGHNLSFYARVFIGGPWTTESVTRKDFLGRTLVTERAGYGGSMLVTSNAFDAAGRLVFTQNHDGSAVAYAYDALGGSAGTVKAGAGQTLDFDPPDFTLADVAALDKYVTEEVPSWKDESDLGLSAQGVPDVWWDCSASVTRLSGQGAVTSSVIRVQLTGLSPACVSRAVTTDADGVTVITTESLDAANARKTVTRLNVATTKIATSATVAGRVTGGTNTLGAALAYLYDGFARQTAALLTTGERNLQTVTGYHEDGTVANTAAVCGGTTNLTAYSERQYLESYGGSYLVTVTDPLGNVTTNLYAGDGTLYFTGGADYPAAVERDADGRRVGLRTWRDESGQPDTTRWHYDLSSGLVTNKVYADGLGPSYAYTPDGRLSQRTWARGVSTDYGYDDTEDGATKYASYSDATPGVTNTYDLAGRLVSVEDGTGTRSFAYDARGRVTAETNALAVIERCCDSAGRDAGHDLLLPGLNAMPFSVRYGHDASGRLSAVTSSFGVDTNEFTLSYLPGTALLSGTTSDLDFGRQIAYEPARDLISSVSNLAGAVLISANVYTNDAAGRRVSRNADTFAFNGRSEVTYAALGTNAYSYAFDGIGNRTCSSVNSVDTVYTVNNLNQYTSVNAVTPQYDADGNLTSYGGWTYTYNAENRMTSASYNSVAVASYVYDYRNRCVRETTENMTRHFVWDRWNIVATVDIDSVAQTTNVARYVWGPDVSGTLQGAGGVGGLLAVIRTDGTYFPCYDGNGNITEYVDVSGTVRARYVYSPFGVTVEQSGDLADTFLSRFSTKPFHQATGLYKYQLRDYHPPLGKWLSRDPLGDEAFLQQYTSDMSRSESKHWRERSMHPTYLFVQNNPLLFFDYLGLDLTYSGCKCCPEIDDAVRRANRAFRKGTCKEWFEEHGHNYSSGTPSRSVACHGNWKLPCMLGFPAWTMPGMGIGVCNSKCKELGSVALASLLVHELAHHYCTYGLGRENCAISAQEACSEALME